MTHEKDHKHGQQKHGQKDPSETEPENDEGAQSGDKPGEPANPGQTGPGGGQLTPPHE